MRLSLWCAKWGFGVQVVVGDWDLNLYTWGFKMQRVSYFVFYHWFIDREGSHYRDHMTVFARQDRRKEAA